MIVIINIHLKIDFDQGSLPLVIYIIFISVSFSKGKKLPRRKQTTSPAI